MKLIIQSAIGFLLSVGICSPVAAQSAQPAQSLYKFLDLDKFVDQATVAAQKALDQKATALTTNQNNLVHNSADAVASAKTEFRIRMLKTIDEHFTAHELNDVNAFLGSDAGKAFRNFSPKLGHVLALELLRASLSVAKAKFPPK